MRAMVLAAAIGLSCWAEGCQNESMEGRNPDPSGSPREETRLTRAPSYFVEREFWLALAEEPRWHLEEARTRYLAGKTREAARELEKVAAILTFETRHGHGRRERDLLYSSVSELREVARQLRLGTDKAPGSPSLAEFDRVLSLTFRTIAAHDVALGRDALEAGDARMTGRYMQETVGALRTGFEIGGITLGSALSSDLDQAQAAAIELETAGRGTRAGVSTNLRRLNQALRKLEETLTGQGGA